MNWVKSQLSQANGRIEGLDHIDRALIAWIEKGLPLSPHPYAGIASELGLSEEQVVERLIGLGQRRIIKRLGVVVRHRELGYRANAMVVWDIPDDVVGKLGRRFSAYDFITLCYRRPRQRPHWPYNLFCMIHGKSRDEVSGHIERLKVECGLQSVDYHVLFSRHCFKQRGARYRAFQESMSRKCPDEREYGA